MSKIGRKPIDISDLQVDIKGQELHYKGKEGSGVYTLPDVLEAVSEDKKLFLKVKSSGLSRNVLRDANRVWGLHRALLFNNLQGAAKAFERKLEINGLGYKAVLSGNKVTFSLGYSHKINFELPQNVSLIIDKSGQKLTFKSINKELLGKVCSQVRAFRPPEPYKGTGIKYESEVIVRKAGKAKSV